MTQPPARPPKHRGFKVFCPLEGERRGRRQALVDFASTCKAGCPFYSGKDVTGVFCSFRRANESDAPRASNAVALTL